MFEFKLPELAENVDSATVTKIFVAEGETITADQNVVELETEKAAMEVPCPEGGLVKEVLVKEGEEVKVGQTILKVEAGATAPTTPAPKEKAPPKAQTKVEAPSPRPAPSVTPRAPATATATMPTATQITTAQKDIPAAPSVRRFAREVGINIAQVPGSGPGGRISKNDVKAFVKGIIQTGQLAVSAPSAPQKNLPDFAKWGQVRREAMNNVRKKTAEHLSYCWNTIPHVTQFGKADITDLEKIRKKHSAPERKLTVTPFLMKIMAAALKEFPQFNASIDMQTNEIIYKEYSNIGVAVDTERGLLVPVIRDVDKKDIFELTDELNAAAERARNRKTSLDELQGGSMTLTNLGGIGGTYFTPIINWPEVAILGVSRGGYEPVYKDGEFTPRFMLPLSLSYDHRVIDGADGARFLKWVCETIEQPFPMEG